MLAKRERGVAVRMDELIRDVILFIQFYYHFKTILTVQ